MKIAFCASEVAPFVKTGGLADVCGTLPIALEKLGEEIVVFLPQYKLIEAHKFNIKRIETGLSTTKIGQNILVYFVEHENFFGRDGLYGDGKGDYLDNLERFQFFCLKILEYLQKLNIAVDVIHCHDWQTALIPVYLRSVYKKERFFGKVRTVMTIHNLAYQGIFSKALFPHLHLDKSFFSPEGLEFYNQINLLKGAIIYSDCATTVSPQYAKEILTRHFGCGLEGVLRHHKDGVIGILNGLDYNFWDPEHDEFIESRYSLKTIEKKYINKTKCQEFSKLPVRGDVPLFGYVGRLVHQKGFDLLAEDMESMAHLDLQLVVLGLGEEKYYRLLKQLAKRYPKKIACHFVYDEKMAHIIYAGSDIFIMPSWYEPCGLSQMISLRYGTIPLVHKTGGLADTIQSFEERTGEGYGFVFKDYTREALKKAVEQAIETYHQKDIFRKLMHRGMELRFSWDKSAKQYQEVFQQCLVSV